MYPFDILSLNFPSLSSCLLVVFLILFTKWILDTLTNILSMPSGPWGVPFLGYLPFIKENLYLEFEKFAAQYGPVFSIKLGQENIVVICDWPHMKEAIMSDALLARPKATFFPGVVEVQSFAEMSGTSWRDHRRLSLHILRDVGMGKNVLENLIVEEIETFLSELDNGEQPVDFMRKLSPSVSNNVAILLFGHKFDYQDPIKVKLDESNETVGRLFSFADIFAFMPWLARLLVAFRFSKMDVVANAVLFSDSYFRKEVEMHQNKTTHESIDYIDGYLEEKQKRDAHVTRDGSKVNSNSFSYDTLRRNCAAFFGAGSETVLSTMSYAVFYLLKYPEFQDKIQSEIEEVIGYERKPEYTDRMRMPFTMAFLYEVHRIGSVIPINLFRRTTQTITLGSYKIPKDTKVLFNFWSVHYDPKLWTDPEKFNPARFLTENGTKVVKPPYLVPFSGGKRSCPGESLANVELFLYLVCMVQRFRIQTEPGTKLVLKTNFGISRRPEQLPRLIFAKHSR